jgi:rhamnosyltransferase
LSGGSTWAVVVLHHPDLALLHRQFEAVSPQVEGIVYCDNGAGAAALGTLGLDGEAGVHRIGDGANCGLASALNDGLRFATARGAAFVLLLDQDSTPDPDLVERLRGGYLGAGAGRPVAAVGPAIFDDLLGRRAPFGQALALRHRLVPRDPRGFFEVSYLITSGALIPVAALTSVGEMEEDLFIDSIDHEWSFRARARGHRLLATYDTCLRHRRGERLHRAWCGLRVRLHPPFRLFFIYRNQVRLFLRGYVPWTWKVRSSIELVLRMALLAALVPGRGPALRAMLRGVCEGLTGRRTSSTAT